MASLKHHILRVSNNKDISNIKNIDDLFKAKESLHKGLAKISFEEKIKILVRLQEIANNIRKPSQKNHRVWKIT